MSFVKVAAVAAASFGPTALAAGGGTFRTAAGVEVPTPALAGLDCAEMRRVLAALDASGYRGASPQPIDMADIALLEYENRLSAVFYQTCVEEPALAARPETAFGGAEDGGDP
jgi:hypothetical protein